MNRIEQLKADLASVLLDVKPLAERSKAGTLSADEDARFDELVSRAQGIQQDINAAEKQMEKADAILTLDRQYNQPADTVNRGLSLDTASEPGGDGYKTPGRKFIESDELARARKTGTGVMKDTPVQIGQFFGPDAQKAVINSGTAAASMLLPQVLSTIYRPGEAPLRMRDVLMNLTTASDTITVMQESGFTNNAAEVAESTANNGTGLTGGVKPLSDLTFTEASFPVRWVAHYVEITRQMLEDLAFMEGYINERLLTGLKRREDAQILNGNGTAPNLRGILQTSGIQSLTTAGEFTTSAVKDAGTANENLNRLRRAIRKIRWTALAEPNFIVLNPVDAEELDTISDANRNYLIGGPLLPAQRRIWGLPVVESANIAAKTALVGDGTMAAVVDRSQARIYTTDSHADYFIRNMFVILAEERIALPVFRPEAFASVQLA